MKQHEFTNTERLSEVAELLVCSMLVKCFQLTVSCSLSVELQDVHLERDHGNDIMHYL